MPESIEPLLSSRQTRRRSARLNKDSNLSQESNAKKHVIIGDVDGSARKRRKVAEPRTSTLVQPLASASDHTKHSSKLIRDKSDAQCCTQRLTSSQITKREKALLQREKEYEQRVVDLEKREVTLSNKEDEVNSVLSQMAEREAKSALAQLEEHFTCALCYEIMAQPYSLNPGQCGHTFCSLCILKWFFSRLHKACGGWHESVDCPMCRSLLVITPDRVPRLDVTFPFVPNRTATTISESLIDKIHQCTSMHKFTVKCEEREGTWGLDCSTKPGKSKLEAGESSGLNDWEEHGLLKSEWLKKAREGKKEMDYLLRHWTQMRAEDFVAMKQRLGV